ncbi:response regulator [Streptomyces sp. BI20]|uniref:response regulator n=1 Tax=Streptomyces sp. BI20 TaxID=3403460 RepID=UPI003C7299D6
MSPSPEPPEPLSVVVVDDDRRVAALHAAQVARVPGFRVPAVCHSVAQAWEALTEAPADLVLLDHYLPDGTGLDLVRRLRGVDPHPDVIMVTAARDLATVRAALRLGTLQYLVKPFGFAALRTRLTAYAELRRELAGADATGAPAEVEQAEVDRLFSTLAAATGPPELPKGHSPGTAELVRGVLRAAGGDSLSAQRIAERAGISRQTAQRYLKLLERAGRVELSLRYGEGAGRPEHRYTWRPGPSPDPPADPR